MKSGTFNFLETSEPLQACDGTALPLPLPYRELIISLNVAKINVTINNNFLLGQALSLRM